MAKKAAVTSSPEEQILQIARDGAGTSKSWQELSNVIYGVGGAFGRLFPDQSSRIAFAKTEAFKEIDRLIKSLPGTTSNTIQEAVSGKFLLRMPESLHAALLAESEREGVSLNQLCVAKLAMQLRGVVREPARVH